MPPDKYTVLYKLFASQENEESRSLRNVACTLRSNRASSVRLIAAAVFSWQ